VENGKINFIFGLLMKMPCRTGFINNSIGPSIVQAVRFLIKKGIKFNKLNGEINNKTLRHKNRPDRVEEG